MARGSFALDLEPHVSGDSTENVAESAIPVPEHFFMTRVMPYFGLPPIDVEIGFNFFCLLLITSE